jgi:hypothetical protein
MAAITIKLFFPKGDTQGLCMAELSNWTGKALAAPRSELDDLLDRPELTGPGVYLLLGPDPQTGTRAAYIGEAELVRDRVKQQCEKEFWVQAIVFASKDENLTKAHVRYLEGRLIEEAQKVARFKVLNAQPSGSKLPESDREDMEAFLSRMIQLLPVLGCELLTPIVNSSARTSQRRLVGKIKGFEAQGQRTAKGFVVFAGSTGVSSLRPSAPAYVIQAREQLKQNGALVDDGDRLRFTRDSEFSSPSMAAAVICGGQVNGLTFWKDNDGRTLKDIEGAG